MCDAKNLYDERPVKTSSSLDLVTIRTHTIIAEFEVLTKQQHNHRKVRRFLENYLRT